LEDGLDHIIGDANLLNHATRFYKTLFGLIDGNKFDMHPDLWKDEDCVSEEENAELTKPFSEEEISKALGQMEINKAAGPNGFPIEFCQWCWPFMKQDIMELFEEFYKGSLDIRRINYGIITLQPKVKEAVKIQ
jgi:hypothetical protein